MNCEIQRLFDLAAELPSDERPAFLVQSCQDSLVRVEVESLLQYATGEESRFADMVRDVSELLAELGEVRAVRRPLNARVVYHDACHLAHGQGVRAQPRALLRGIPGVELLAVDEAEICCGSAGIYNLIQPEPAAQLGARKVRHIAASSPDMIATANPGCMLQIAAAARGLGYDWPIFHPIELIDASIHGVDPRTRG